MENKWNEAPKSDADRKHNPFVKTTKKNKYLLTFPFWCPSVSLKDSTKESYSLVTMFQFIKFYLDYGSNNSFFIWNELISTPLNSFKSVIEYLLEDITDSVATVQSLDNTMGQGQENAEEEMEVDNQEEKCNVMAEDVATVVDNTMGQEVTMGQENAEEVMEVDDQEETEDVATVVDNTMGQEVTMGQEYAEEVIEVDDQEKTEKSTMGQEKDQQEAQDGAVDHVVKGKRIVF